MTKRKPCIFARLYPVYYGNKTQLFSMNILVLNCGSSSIKYQLLKMENGQEGIVIAKGLVERIGLSEGIITHTTEDKIQRNMPIPDHAKGINEVFNLLIDSKYGAIDSLDDIHGVGHRVAHGGSFFSNSTLITEEVIEKINECAELAPLHNPANLKGILTVKEKMPRVRQVAVFDTAFHQTLPAKAYMYALPYEMYSKLKVRKYGFHGTSHKFVAEKACEILGWNFNEKKIITCHLGNGASVCAIENGKSVETSMGFTPNEGLIMGTRTGNLDLGALLYIGEKKHLNISQTNDLINKESGMQGISGISSDMRDLEDVAAKGNERAQLALDMYAYRVRKFVGAYTAILNGVDLIIFTGGIGENDSQTRAKVLQNFDFIDLQIDTEKNNVRGKDAKISTDDSKVLAMTITTNEELVIAKDTKKLITQS